MKNTAMRLYRGMQAVVLMATPCTKLLGEGKSSERRFGQRVMGMMRGAMACLRPEDCPPISPRTLT